MRTYTPEEAIREYVSGIEPNPSPFSGIQLPKPDVLKRTATLRFLQGRRLPYRQVHEVTFENETGQQERWLCFVVQDEQGNWSVRSAGEVRASPLRSRSWVNLMGGGREDDFWAGGLVTDHHLAVERVRLTAANGTIVEDIVREHLVLFVTNQQVRMPLQVQLYDHSGNLLATQTFPEQRHP